ncbi:MAG: hypothetical protein RLZZ324_29 [Candidatus Parcubacteria bacterium]|jgi:Zn-dependent protease with chaperone function
MPPDSKSSFTFALSARHSAALAAFVALALASGAAAGIAALAGGGRMADWCRDMLVSVSGLRAIPAGLAVVGIALMAVAAIKEAARMRALRRMLASRRVPLPGKMLAALSDLGRGAERISAVRDDRPFAYAYGLASPRIAVSTALTSALTKEELKSVLRHELRHADARHPLRAFLWELSCRAFFFLPVLRDLADHFALVRELDADLEAQRGRGGRKTLASALIKVMESSRASPQEKLALASVAAFGQLTERIHALAGSRSAAVRIGLRRGAVSMLSAAFTVAVTALPASAMFHAPAEGACQAVLERTVERTVAAIMSPAPGPMSEPAGPSSTETDLRSREIGP